MENNISHGPGTQDPNISPYWSDSSGRRANAVPPLNLEVFKPKETPCSFPVSCNASWPYRLMSGYCNNLLNLEFGAAGQPLPRILPPTFDEGLIRRFSVTGSLLPNLRVVSLGVREIPPRVQTNHNMMIMQIGQFIDHDYVFVQEIENATGGRKECKDCTSWRDTACAPIPVPIDDPYIPARSYGTGRPMCLPFTRSVAVTGKENFGRTTINQVNSNSAFLDLSTVYGSDACRERSLRTFNDGQLLGIKQAQGFLKGLPPFVDAAEFEFCRSKEK